MSSILLADPSKSYFKLSLWREAAVWSERLSIGDIVFLKRKFDVNHLTIIHNLFFFVYMCEL